MLVSKLQTVLLAAFVLLVDLMLMKEELKCVLMEHGVLSVMISGEKLMLQLCVIS